MSDRDRGRERDLVLAPNEFAFISDETKGNINVYVGPHKTSLANTDQPVVFNYQTKRFERRLLEQATQTMSIAPEGWYLVLKNPAKDGSHPRTGALNNLPELNLGRKVTIPGPVSFAQWPGQMVKVIQGHNLRSNQYLVVRVYDEEAAKANWKNAVIKLQTEQTEGDSSSLDPNKLSNELTIGKQLVIKGTEVSFYMPPTGIDVVADALGKYVREAVTLERLEYCILLDEDGNKRFIQGPAVVFPKPTENFVERDGSRKFRAIELNENSGLYVKVIAPYEDALGKHKVGDELFITGKEQMIYFPRPEHAIIRYGAQEIHYGIAIPAGEARYVLDRMTGQIYLKRGPCIFLPDPRKEVIVRRVLDARQASLWFPGNQEVLDYNQRMAALKKQEESGEFIVDQDARKAALSASTAATATTKESPARFAGDALPRQQSYTPPRSIVLDTKYDGAVSINVWPGYAVMVVKKNGERTVVAGPQTHLLEYDETLQPMELSTGTPKTDTTLFRTVYLRVHNNKVSDVIEAETRDLCRVHLRLSYRVNFEGDASRWFTVENYVKFLTEHLRSLLRAAVKQHGIENFYNAAAGIVRDVVLGLQGDEGKRPGRRFEENGMRVYDVEVLDVTITDRSIGDLLVAAQHATVQQALALAQEQRKLELARSTEGTRQAVAELQSSTKLRELELKQREVAEALKLRLAELQSEADAAKRKSEAELAQQNTLGTLNEAKLARERAAAELKLEVEQRELDQRLRALAAEVDSVVQKARSVSPELIAALQAFSDRALAEKMAQSMAPLAILGGESVSSVLSRLLAGTPVAKALEQLEAKTDE